MREKASDFLRRFLREWDPYRDIPEPSLSVTEVQLLFLFRFSQFCSNSLLYDLPKLF